MTYRSIPKLLTLNLLTLGLYEAIWLAQTRNEIVRRYRIILPRSWLLYLYIGLQGILIIAALLVAIFVISANENQITQKRQQVDPAEQSRCVAEYALSQSSVENGGPATVSQHCTDVVNNYLDTTNEDHIMHALYFIGAVVIGLPVISLLFSEKWFWPYARGVERATNGTLSAKTALNILIAAPPFIRISLLQSVFNRTK
jgi:hypothetical protein